MPHRSGKFYAFMGALGVLAGLALLVTLKTGPIAGPLQTQQGIPLATAAELPGANCEEWVVSVKLSPRGWFSHNVAGTLCWTGDLDGKTLAVTVSGAGYGSVYWDFPYQPDIYSFARAALNRQLATFNFDRLGIGRSDRPFGMLLGVDNQAYVLAQIIEALKGKHRFGAIVTLGHSFGSTISLAHALNYPQHVDGLVLTGFVHNSNPDFSLAMRDGVDLAAVKGPFAGVLVDPTYIISKANSRSGIFYTPDNTDPLVIEIDELNRQTTTIGEVVSMPTYFKGQSKQLTIPVFTLVGENDFVVCGGKVHCTDHDAIIAWEGQFFPPAACHEMSVLDDTNHNANLHLNAPASFQLMLDWIERRVGIRGPPTHAC